LFSRKKKYTKSLSLDCTNVSALYVNNTSVTLSMMQHVRTIHLLRSFPFLSIHEEKDELLNRRRRFRLHPIRFV